MFSPTICMPASKESEALWAALDRSTQDIKARYLKEKREKALAATK